MFRISSLIPLLVLRLLLLLIMKNGNNKPHKLKNISMNIFCGMYPFGFSFCASSLDSKRAERDSKRVRTYIVQYSDWLSLVINNEKTIKIRTHEQRTKKEENKRRQKDYLFIVFGMFECLYTGCWMVQCSDCDLTRTLFVHFEAHRLLVCLIRSVFNLIDFSTLIFFQLFLMISRSILLFSFFFVFLFSKISLLNYKNPIVLFCISDHSCVQILVIWIWIYI